MKARLSILAIALALAACSLQSQVLDPPTPTPGAAWCDRLTVAPDEPFWVRAQAGRIEATRKASWRALTPAIFQGSVPLTCVAIVEATGGFALECSGASADGNIVVAAGDGVQLQGGW